LSSGKLLEPAELEDLVVNLTLASDGVESYLDDDTITEVAARLKDALPANLLDVLTDPQGEKIYKQQLLEFVGQHQALLIELDSSIKTRLQELSDKFEQGTQRVLEGQEQGTQKILAAIREEAVERSLDKLKQLPPPPSDFVGRKEEREELLQAARRGGVAISGLHGMGGIGKTALALKLAADLKAEYPDAQIFLDMKGVSAKPVTPADAMWHVITSFHLEAKRPDTGDAESESERHVREAEHLKPLYLSLLEGQRALLFYDNVKDESQGAPLRPPAGCLMIVTSRRHLALSGMYDKHLEKMLPADARDLLCNIEPRLAERADEVAELLDYLPMALRPAASLLKKQRALNPADLLRRLADRKRRLELTDPETNMSVEASLGLSYESLGDDLRRRWRALAVFPDTFDVIAAAALWGTDFDEAKDCLAELEEYSLLEWNEADERFSLHDLARDFADARLSDEEREAAQRAHAGHYAPVLALANDLYEQGHAGINQGLAVFTLEQINIEAGQAWAAIKAEQDEEAATLCLSYANSSYVLHLRQHPRDFIRWQEAGLRAARKLGDREREGIHLGNLGLAYARLGEVRKAIEHHQQALRISREIGDKQGEGNHLGNSGVAYARLGEREKALELVEAALKIFEEIESPNADAARQLLETLRGAE